MQGIAAAFQAPYRDNMNVVQSLRTALIDNWTDFVQHELAARTISSFATAGSALSDGLRSLSIGESGSTSGTQASLTTAPTAGPSAASVSGSTAASDSSQPEPPRERKLACYTALVQSSMYGKSRLIFELAKTMFTIYTCIRPGDQETQRKEAAFPPVDLEERNFFLQATADRDFVDSGFRFLAYYVAWLSKFCEWHQECGPSSSSTHSYETWFQYQQQSQLRDKVLLLTRQIAAPFFQDKQQYSGINLPDERKAILNTLKTIVNIEAIVPYLRSQHVLLVLALDEAASLTSARLPLYDRPLFIYARRALTFVQVSLGAPLVMVFADTSARLSNYAPPLALLPSARRLPEPQDLYPPFVHIATTDVLIARDQSTWSIHENKSTAVREQARTPKFDDTLYALGRAGFGHYYGHLDFLPFIELLSYKLCGAAPGKLYQTPSLERLEASLAIIACMVVLDIAPSSRVTTDLIASRMATCLGVSDDRQTLLAAYVSEPALSIAARNLFFDLAYQPHILHDLIKIIAYGLVAPGPIGEIVSELVIQFGIGPTSTEIFQPLESVLKNLLLPDVLAPVMKELAVDNYVPFIGLTHFIPCTYDLTLADLDQFLRRSAGIRCKDGQRGTDVVIPILYVKQDITKDGPDHVVSFWSIQVKNRIADTMKDEEVQAGLAFGNYFQSTSDRLPPAFPYLAMHLSLRPSEEVFQRHLSRGVDRQQVTVRCQGLQSMPLFQGPHAVDVVMLLETLLVTRSDARELVCDRLQPLLRAMTPLTYKPPTATAKCPKITKLGLPCKSFPTEKCHNHCCSSHCRFDCRCSSEIEAKK